MNSGQIVGFLYTLAVWCFLILVFVVPISLAYWYARERREREATKEALKRTRQSTDTSHIWDGA